MSLVSQSLSIGMGLIIFCGTRNFILKLLFLVIGFASGVYIHSHIFGKGIRQSEQSVYNEVLAQKLRKEIKIMCMIMTNPVNHRRKAIYVRNTWGKRCNKLMFITTKDDPELDTIVVHANESRKALRRKTKTAFLYVHDKHLREFDWFLKADDDK